MDDSRISAAEMFPAQYAAHSARKWIFQSPSKVDMCEIRELAKCIKREHGVKLSVRKGTGSMKHAIRISSYAGTVEARIALVQRLVALGFESVNAPYGFEMSLVGHGEYLARAWKHTSITLSVARLRHNA